MFSRKKELLHPLGLEWFSLTWPDPPAWGGARGWTWGWGRMRLRKRGSLLQHGLSFPAQKHGGGTGGPSKLSPMS